MQNEDFTPEELTEERERFYMYRSYEEQMALLTDEQVGRVMRGVFHYLNTGEKLDQEREVNLMLSVITCRLDFDARRYTKKVEKRREAGRKGGLASASKRARERRAEADEEAEANEAALEAMEQMQVNEATPEPVEQMQTNEAIHETVEQMQAKQATLAIAKQSQANQADRDNDKDREKDKDNDNEKERDRTLSNSSSGSRSAGARRSPMGDYILYGEDCIPSTEAELAQFEALAEELYRTYLHKQPSPHEYESVFRHSYVRREGPDGNGYAAYSPEKADLLRHVFRVAADQHKLTWGYIEGILNNYERYGIKTAEEALQHDYRWKRGAVS